MDTNAIKKPFMFLILLITLAVFFELPTWLRYNMYFALAYVVFFIMALGFILMG